MAIVVDSFDAWLSKKLQALSIDESIFAPYIKGILEGDETDDEKLEILTTTVAGVTEIDVSEQVSEILGAWTKWLPTDDCIKPAGPSEDVDVRLVRMLESQSLPAIIHKNYTDDELRVREAILSQYSQMSVEEQSDIEDEVEDVERICGIEKNTNTAIIIQQEKEKREKAKLESQKKREKDKEDREKQKQLKEEKKEKRKTQKGERRR